ncbi:MAG: hypothetical protein WCK33_05560 [Phycisphaerae bacterium]|jgi:hypothetical protein
MNRRGMWFVPVAVLIAACGAANAQESKSPDQQPLRGPTVRDDTVPGESRRFTGGAQRRKDSVGASIPNRVFVKAIDSLRDEQADPTIRLAPEQADRIAKIERDLRQKQLAFLSEHRDEIAEIRRSAPPEMRRRIEQLFPGSAGARARRNAEENAVDQPAKAGPSESDGQMQMDGADATMRDDKAAAEAIRDRAAALLEAAPKVEEVHGSVWAVLTPAQREHVEKQVERLKAELAAKRDEAKGNRKEKEADAVKTGASPAPAVAPDLSKLPPRIRERWESMTPEQREEALKRLKNRG